MIDFTPAQRAEAVELAKLNDIAYQMYPKDPLKPKFPDFPGYVFVAWIQMQDFDMHSRELPYCFYGFIVQKKDDLNSFILVVRGTQKTVELYDDCMAAMSTPFQKGGNVAYGFDRIFQTMRVMAADGTLISAFGAMDFPTQVKIAIEKHVSKLNPQGSAPAKSITVTGHSLGSALATLYVAKIANDQNLCVRLLCTFASPLVGDAGFADWFNKLGIQSWRIANKLDVVTTVPPGLKHIEKEYSADADVKNSIDCQHAIETYLHLIDPANFELRWLCKKFGPDIT